MKILQLIKNSIKPTPFFNFIVYIRYNIWRYFFQLRIKPFKITSKYALHPIENDGVTFFGYYNLSPINSNNELIYLKVKEENVRGSLTEKAKINIKYTDGKSNEICQTSVWNWQQGCMLQWLGPTFDQIIFNDFDNGDYVSKIINKKGDLLKKLNKPIYSVAKNGEFALTLSFERLAMYRPDYGYFNKANNELLPDGHDGIWYLNLLTGESNLIITLDQLKQINFVETMINAQHKVNHIDINPGGTRFMFLHRWKGPKGRFMRLLTANVDGNEMCILNGDEMTSHCCWKSNNKIISFCTLKGIGTGYFEFTDKMQDVKKISDKLPQADGHPSVSPSGEYLLTDTYPDRARMSHLYLYKFETDELMEIGQFWQPLRYRGEMRIDLHPKWGNSHRTIFFESGHSGKRKLYKAELKI